MAASVECRREEMSSGEIKEKENGDDLSLFVDFSGVDLNLDLLQKSNQIQVAFDSASEYQLKPETKSIIHGQDSGAAEDLLNSMNNITDYDWLLSPPRHPLPSLEIEEQITLTDHSLISNGQSTFTESKLENPTADVTLTTNVSSSNGVKPASTIRRPSPSRKAPSTGSRSATPTTRATSTSRATVTAATKPAGPIIRSTTPTTRPPILIKSASRSSTPIQRASVTVTGSAKSASRSSTATQRPSVTVTATASAKSASRSSTPTQRPSSAKSATRSSTPTQRPSVTVTASAKSASRSSTPTQRPSATVTASAKSASRLSTPTQRPSVTASAKSASRSSTPTKRPSVTVTASAKSASRSSTPTQRPSVTASAKSASRSSTPTLRSSNGGVKSGRGYSNGYDDVNPVLMGTQMVERVVNMRKLAPPRQDNMSDQDNASGKLSVSQNNSGFGRSLSKKSFDMALRHLDIRRSMPGNMRASITKVPASSVYSVRPESTKTRIMSVSDSPLATSSSASSEDIPTTNH